MKKSRYFSDLFRSYLDEIDDLVTDSDGKSVLQKRLQDKRREMAALLSMIDFSPEMVAVVFYDAFGFRSADVMQRLVLSEPGVGRFSCLGRLEGKPDGCALGGGADRVVAESTRWRRLSRRDGRTGISARNKDTFAAPAEESKAESTRDDEDGGDDDADDLGEAGADWLAEQGFETLDR